MKATPIAEFLQRKGADAPKHPPGLPAPASPAFNPRKVSAANDDPEPEFRRSGLIAALARRSPEGPPLVRPLEASSFAPRRQPAPASTPSTPRSPETEADIEARLSEAYHRGVQEGLDAGKAESATARAMERVELQKRAVIDKLDFQMNEYARLSEQLAQGFAELERRLAQAMARVLKPLVVDAVAKQIIDELVENVARLTRSGNVGLLKVRGPEGLLSALRPKIEALAVEVEYVEDAGVEITVNAQTTEIRSELRTWAQLIDEIVENG